MDYLPQTNGYVSMATLLSVTGLSYSRQKMFADRARVKRVLIPDAQRRSYGFSVPDTVKLLEAAGWKSIRVQGRDAVAKQIIYLNG